MTLQLESNDRKLVNAVILGLETNSLYREICYLDGGYACMIDTIA
jgi:hypothetical protein